MRNVPVPPSRSDSAVRPPPGVDAGGARASGRYATDESMGDLIGNVTRDLTILVRQEMSLARAELKHEALASGRAAGALGGAGVAASFAALFVSLASWAGLSVLMHPGWAALSLAVVWTVIAAFLYVGARARIRRIDPGLTRTTDTLGQVADAVKGNRGGGS